MTSFDPGGDSSSSTVHFLQGSFPSNIYYTKRKRSVRKAMNTLSRSRISKAVERKAALSLLFLLGAPLLSAQDAVKVAPKNFKVLVENEQVRVVQDTLASGEIEAMHTHPAGWYYVTMPGTMKVTRADGKTEIWNAKAGEQAWMDAEPAHTSENVGKTTMAYILVEVKSAAAARK